MVCDGSGHCGQHVRFGIGLQQCQYLGRLVFAATLFRQQSFQEARARFAKLGESFAEALQLLLMVPRRSMGRIHDRLQRMPVRKTMLGDRR